MTDFELFFPEGFKHITDLDGYDHILFIAALTVRYLIGDWKKLLLLVTAFTIGHSITLALSSFDLVGFERDWIEFLIPVTIFITAVVNLRPVRTESTQNMRSIYLMAVIFGLIHGLGFSSYLKSMFGKDESIWVQLLAFNLGLEIGQLIIVMVLLIISFIFVSLLKLRRSWYIRIVCAIIIVLSLKMCIERFPFKSKEQNEETAILTVRSGPADQRVSAEHTEQSRL